MALWVPTDLSRGLRERKDCSDKSVCKGGGGGGQGGRSRGVA